MEISEEQRLVLEIATKIALAQITSDTTAAEMKIITAVCSESASMIVRRSLKQGRDIVIERDLSAGVHSAPTNPPSRRSAGKKF
jgi:hypothetical protein